MARPCPQVVSGTIPKGICNASQSQDSYVLFIGGLVLLAGVWLLSTYLFGNTITEVGRPVLIGIAVLRLGGVGIGRRLGVTDERAGRFISSYDWTSRK